MIRAGDIVRVVDGLRDRPMFPEGPAEVIEVYPPSFAQKTEALIEPIDELERDLRGRIQIDILEPADEPDLVTDGGEDEKRAIFLRSIGYDRGESIPWVASVRYGVDPDDDEIRTDGGSEWPDCNWKGCENPAGHVETVRNPDTGDLRDVDLCEKHYRRVWDIHDEIETDGGVNQPVRTPKGVIAAAIDELDDPDNDGAPIADVIESAVSKYPPSTIIAEFDDMIVTGEVYCPSNFTVRLIDDGLVTDGGQRLGSRFDRSSTSYPCPQDCGHPRGMNLVTHYTGRFDFVDTPRGPDEIELTETYYECPGCGWVIDS